jgi:hypothetical protein
MLNETADTSNWHHTTDIHQLILTHTQSQTLKTPCSPGFLPGGGGNL